MPRAVKCVTCDGTGRQVLLRSAFKSDGYRSCRCGICAGTGVSSYKPAAKVLAQYRRIRADAAASRAAA